jgi:hypothetical protein
VRPLGRRAGCGEIDDVGVAFRGELYAFQKGERYSEDQVELVRLLLDERAYRNLLRDIMSIGGRCQQCCTDDEGSGTRPSHSVKAV